MVEGNAHLNLSVPQGSSVEIRFQPYSILRPQRTQPQDPGQAQRLDRSRSRGPRTFAIWGSILYNDPESTHPSREHMHHEWRRRRVGEASQPGPAHKWDPLKVMALRGGYRPNTAFLHRRTLADDATFRAR